MIGKIPGFTINPHNKKTYIIDLSIYLVIIFFICLLISRFVTPEMQWKNTLWICFLSLIGYTILLLTAKKINIHSAKDKDQKANHKVNELKIEDLLMRDEIQIDMNLVRKLLTDKNVLVTGAAGSIGSELCYQLAQINIKKLIILDFAETPIHNIRLKLEKQFPNLNFIPIIGDVRNKKRIEEIILTYKPNIIFHAAAYKHVPLMEENPCEAVLANVHGTRIVADAALKYGVEKMIFVSTDKAVNPTNVMGATKRLAEIYVQSLGGTVEQRQSKGTTQFVTTRFGNVLGSQGSVIPLFKKQIKSGGPVTVTHPEITRYFMTIPEACKLVIEAAAIGDNNEIFVFDMGKSVRIADLARRMIELSGYIPEQDIQIIYTGLRPGEKLYEELLNSQENTQPTPYKKIYIAKVRKYTFIEIQPLIKQIIKNALSGNELMTVHLMKELIPEFHSENSKFKVLDYIHANIYVS